MTMNDILHEVEQLPTAQKWVVFKHLVALLETETKAEPPEEDYQVFLRRTYGSLRDDPIQRWPQGEYEERDPIE